MLSPSLAGFSTSTTTVIPSQLPVGSKSNGMASSGGDFLPSSFGLSVSTLDQSQSSISAVGNCALNSQLPPVHHLTNPNNQSASTKMSQSNSSILNISSNNASALSNSHTSINGNVSGMSNSKSDSSKYSSSLYGSQKESSKSGKQNLDKNGNTKKSQSQNSSPGDHF